MIRKLMASTAVLALATTGAFSIAVAQEQTTQPPAIVQQPAAEQAAPAAADTTSTQTDVVAAAAATEENADAALTPDEPTIATAFIGTSVYSSEDPESDNIGDVNDLIIGDNGMITHAVIGVGGFLGIGEKDVAVPFADLQVVERDGDVRLIYAATKEQLEAAEPFDRTAYDPRARAAEDQALADQAAAPATTDLAAVPVEPVAPATDTAAAPAEQPAASEETVAAAPAADTTQPADSDATAEQTASADSAVAPAGENAADQQTAAATTEQPADSDATAEQTASADTAVAPAGENAADQQTAAATTEQPADSNATAEQTASADTAVAPAGENAADQQTAAATTDTMQSDQPADTSDVAAATEEPAAASDMADGSKFVAFNADQIRASTLIGKEVYGPDDQSVGEISDLILQEDDTRAAIIDVGGFLGIGEKPVAIAFDQLQVTTDADGTRVAIASTADQLNEEPAYVYPEDQSVATTEQPAMTDDTSVAVTDQPATDADTAQTDVAVTQDQAAEGAAMTGNEFRPVTQDLSAAKLIGATVYGQNDENLGEVNDVVLDADGRIEAVLIDIGGFLGVGEKQVAFQFDGLTFQEDQSGSLQLMVNATQEELENSTAYQETAVQ